MPYAPTSAAEPERVAATAMMAEAQQQSVLVHDVSTTPRFGVVFNKPDALELCG